MNFLEKLGLSLAKYQIKNSKTFFILLIILLAITLPGITLLIGHIEPSLEKILPSEISEVKTMNDMRSQFGADMMYLVVRIDGPLVNDMRSPEVLVYLDGLSNRLRENSFIIDVSSVANIVKSQNNGVIPNTLDETKELLKDNPQVRMFNNHDNSLTVVQIRSDTGATASVVKEVVEQIEYDIESVENYNPGVKISITGFNSIDKATFEVIMQDFAYITGFSFLFMVVFLLIYFRSIRKVLGTISVIMISVLVTLGLVGYMNITITVVTMVAAAMIMALGISYGINVIYEYYMLRESHDKNTSLEILNTHLIRALVGSSLTTSAGFLALLFGIIPAMKNLGIVLALGISITLIVSVIFLPVIVYKLDNEKIREKRFLKNRPV